MKGLVWWFYILSATGGSQILIYILFFGKGWGWGEEPGILLWIKVLLCKICWKWGWSLSSSWDIFFKRRAKFMWTSPTSVEQVFIFYIDMISHRRRKLRHPFVLFSGSKANRSVTAYHRVWSIWLCPWFGALFI